MTALKSNADAKATDHASRGECMRSHCRTEHDNGQEDHRLAHAEGLLFDALIGRDRDRSSVSGRLFGIRIDLGHGLSPLLYR
jgi:hypothetical protein